MSRSDAASVRLTWLDQAEYDEWLTAATDRLVELRYRWHSPEVGQARALAQDQLRHDLPAGIHTPGASVVRIEVSRSGRVTGKGTACWQLSADGTQLQLILVMLDDLSWAAATRTAMAGVARRMGANALLLSRFRDDPTSAALADDPSLEVRATTMMLGVAGPPVADDSRVTLRPMTGSEFETFYARERTSYAASRIKYGDSPKLAQQIAADTMRRTLPDGLASPHQHLWVAVAGTTEVGLLWIDTSRPRAFVYQVSVDEAQRRRGYGRSIMTAGARWCHEHGSIALGLNVFGFNTAARSLYDSLGYQVREERLAQTW